MLKTDFKDDVFVGDRKYNLINNADGTVSLVDATDYDIQGDSFGAIELNAITKEVNVVAKYETAGGNGTVITLTDVILEDGVCKTFIANASNGGAATSINGKNLYKPGTTTAPKLVLGKAYNVWYDLTGDCFFIKASAEGNTITAHVLAGDTFSNDDDIGLVGAMINRGAVSQSLAINGSYTIPEGYHNGIGHVSQSIATKGAATITPGTANQTIAANQYLTGIQTILGDADLISANILNGKNIFGIAGSVIAGKRYASGTVTSSSGTQAFTRIFGDKVDMVYITVSGLSFLPSIIIAECFLSNNEYFTIYDAVTPNDLYPKTVKNASFANTGIIDTNGFDIKGDVSPASVVNGSFTIPVRANVAVYNWYAVE